MPRTPPLLGLAAALLLLGAATPAGAEVYRWTDAEGRVHYTQDLGRVPPGKRAEARRWQGSRSPGALQRYAAPEAPSPAPPRTAGVHRVPFERRGNVMLVEVRLNDRVTAPFLVDTGASDVAIPRRLARRLGIEPGPGTPRRVYQTAAGRVAKPVVTLDAVELGSARVEGVAASVSDAMEVGLLGGSFFNHFSVRIDPEERVLTLERSAGLRGGRSEEEWRRRFRSLREGLRRLERYLEAHPRLPEGRTAELERRRRSLGEELEALRAEARDADVPHGWRR